MDLSKFTQKTQEALQSAQALALKRSHVEVDVEHLLLALLEQSDGLIPRLLAKMELDVAQLQASLESELERRPTISGQSLEADKIYVTQRLQKLLTQAQTQAARLKDDYVSVEHLILAMLEEGDSIAARLLRKAGVTKDAFTKALKEVRGNQRVTTDSPEG